MSKENGKLFVRVPTYDIFIFAIVLYEFFFLFDCEICGVFDCFFKTIKTVDAFISCHDFTIIFSKSTHRNVLIIASCVLVLSLSIP